MLQSRDFTDKTYIAPKTKNAPDKLTIGRDFKSGPNKESQITKEARMKKGDPEMNKYSVTKHQCWSKLPHNVKSRRQKWDKTKRVTLFAELMAKTKAAREPGPCTFKPKWKFIKPRTR